MNMAYDYSPDQDFEEDRSVDYSSGSKQKVSSKRKYPSYSRGKKSPAAFNGVHRRRNKRFSW